MTPERFLVPVDFSPEAERAVQEAVCLGRALDAHIVLLHVRDDSELNPWAYSGAAEAATRAALQGYLDTVEAAGLSGEIVLVHGVPWQEIIEIARQHRTTLIVIGARGRTGFYHKLLGSVAENVVRRAIHPVLVARHSDSVSQT